MNNIIRKIKDLYPVSDNALKALTDSFEQVCFPAKTPRSSVDNNRIDIGNDVLIASNVQIYTATHSTKVNERMVQDWSEGDEICCTYALPVKIEDGVWIGGGSIILPGVTIGRNSVIGAGSVVTRSIPATAWRSAIQAWKISFLLAQASHNPKTQH